MSFLSCQSVVDQIRRITSSHCMGWEHWLGFPLGRRGLMFCSVWLVRIMVLTDWLLCNHIKGCKSPNGLGLFFCIHTVEAVFFPLQLISYVLNFHCRYTETKTPPPPATKTYTETWCGPRQKWKTGWPVQYHYFFLFVDFPSSFSAASFRIDWNNSKIKAPSWW